MALLEAYETKQCSLAVMDTGMEAMREKVLMLVSVRKDGGGSNVRFGNRSQVKSMLRAYRRKERIL